MFSRRCIVLFIVLLGLSSCGAGEPTEAVSTRFEGQVLDTTGQGIGDIEVYLFETNESSITDDSGSFSIESFKHLGSSSFYFRSGDYSNVVELGQFPVETLVVRPRFELASSPVQARLVDVSFSSDLTPAETPTPTPAPGETPAAKPTATPKPLFDSNGNTSSFGIPAGMTGNINAGRNVWNGLCLSCHAAEKKNRSFGQTKASARVIPTMQSLNLSNQQIADVTAYLNRGRR